MKKQLVLVKVGGGFITDKSQFMTENPQAIKHIARELSRIHMDYSGIDMIIGNGVGSFGHFTAYEYGLQGGAKSDIAKLGVAKTHMQAQKISSLLAEEFLQCDIPTLMFSPASMLLQRSNGISIYSDSLDYAIESGYIPLVHGDTILDTEKGVKIFSTEHVLFECLKLLRVRYDKVTVVYITSSEGVLDEFGGTLTVLPRHADIHLHDFHAHDVSGGIYGKVASARQAADMADEVFIIGGWQLKTHDTLADRWRKGTRIL